jgi:hypothetical protein
LGFSQHDAQQAPARTTSWQAPRKAECTLPSQAIGRYVLDTPLPGWRAGPDGAALTDV